MMCITNIDLHIAVSKNIKPIFLNNGRTLNMIPMIHRYRWNACVSWKCLQCKSNIVEILIFLLEIYFQYTFLKYWSFIEKTSSGTPISEKDILFIWNISCINSLFPRCWDFIENIWIQQKTVAKIGITIFMVEYSLNILAELVYHFWEITKLLHY